MAVCLTSNILFHHLLGRLFPFVCARPAFSPSARMSSVESSSSEISEEKSGLSLSDSCVKKLQELRRENKATYLRIFVEGGGCSGFQYKFDLEEKTLEDEDRVFERDGARVVIDETSLEYLKGSVIDYHKELIRAAFRIMDNPKADTGCSCGASFSVKID